MAGQIPSAREHSEDALSPRSKIITFHCFIANLASISFVAVHKDPTQALVPSQGPPVSAAPVATEQTKQLIKQTIGQASRQTRSKRGVRSSLPALYQLVRPIRPPAAVRAENLNIHPPKHASVHASALLDGSSSTFSGSTYQNKLPSTRVAVTSAYSAEVISANLRETITASQQKRRKLAPFGNAYTASTATDKGPSYNSDRLDQQHLFDTQAELAHLRSSPASSPHLAVGSAVSSPRSGSTSPSGLFGLPPHIREERKLSFCEGASPSSAFAGIALDSFDMPSSDNGAAPQEVEASVNAVKTFSTRSTSPAKRTAADMEGQQIDEGKTDFDEALERVKSSEACKSSLADVTVAATPDPPRSSPVPQQNAQSFSTAEIDEQVLSVTELQLQALDVGQMGIVVSNRWLARVMSRSTDGLQSSEFSKDAREGPIGAVNNSDIVPERAFDTAKIHDAEGHVYVPLKPGLVIGEDFEVFNKDSWDEVMKTYGLQSGQQQIIRYVRDTAPPEAHMPNLQYELYPNTFTICKMPSADQQNTVKPTGALQNLRRSQERRTHGQVEPDDPVRMVASRQEKFQQFLKRGKEAAEIPLQRRVRVWKVLDEPAALNESPDGRPLSPPQSRESSPKTTFSRRPTLVVDATTFKSLKDEDKIKEIDMKDESNNSNYNGKSTLERLLLIRDSILVFEELEISAVVDVKKALKPGILSRKIQSAASSAPASGRTSPAPVSSGMMTRGRSRRDGRTRGTLGLTNLGNTCYMNSALQCIRSIEELAVYFLTEKYKQEINTNNPLGHNGIMAKQYAGVLSSIYADHATGAVTPSSFKKTLGQLQPLFSGYGQQDSQEFLSFLVDALHEDLNRIQKKPYIENPDSDDGTVHDPEAIIKLGETYRTNHASRNDSVAMDLFNGFYKNTMECPECDKISITFDPYSLVTLQLPSENTFQHTITFIPLSGEPVNHAIDMDRNSTMKFLKEYIASKHPGVNADRLWMAEVYNHKLFKVFDDASTLAEASISHNDYIFMFELDEIPTNTPLPSKRKSYGSFNTNKPDDTIPDMEDPRADRFAVPVFSRQKSRYGNGWDMIMHPMYIVLTREDAKDYEVILKKVLIAVSRLTDRPILTEFSPTDAEMVDMTPSNGESEDNAKVSDHSVQSEDGYVEVLLGKSMSEKPSEPEEASPALNSIACERSAPVDFMSPQHYVPAELRNQLFTMKYGTSDSGAYCTGMTGLSDRSIRTVRERVKLPSRRSSVQSSTSSGSSASETSTSQGKTETEDNSADAEEVNHRDIVMGELPNGQESYLGMPTPTKADDESDNDSLPEYALRPSPGARSGRRKNLPKNKKHQDQKTYSRKNRRAQRRNQLRNNPSVQRNVDRSARLEDDSPYYIKIGEGIVLDWFPEGLDELFGGESDDDSRKGRFVSKHDGKGLRSITDPAVEEKRRRREERRKNGITLEDCFSETGKRERLSEDNAWYCNRCKKLQQATKTLEIWTIPDILVVHLKRFGGNRSARDKIDTMVDYPIEGLDMTPKIGCKEEGKEYIYDLFAVDCHFGGLGGGHYTAMAKNFYDGQWYDYNDSSCSKIGERALRTASAYLLFYRRRSDTPLGPQYLQDLVQGFRDPQPLADQPADSAAEDSDTGEGVLGGQASSLGGPSSNFTAAAAGAENNRGLDAGSPGVLRLAGSSPTMRMVTEENLRAIDAKSSSRVEQPRQYGDHGNSLWNFENLGDLESEDLQHNMSGPFEQDFASDVADNDSVGAQRADDEEGDEMPPSDPVSGWSTSPARNSPAADQYEAYRDDLNLYSVTHSSGPDGDLHDSLHFEDDDPPPVQVHLDAGEPAAPPPLEDDVLVNELNDEE